MATHMASGLQSPISLGENTPGFDHSHISSTMDTSAVSGTSNKPHNKKRSLNHKKSKSYGSHGSPNSFRTNGSASKRNSLQSSLTTTTQATTASGFSQQSQQQSNGQKGSPPNAWSGVKTAFASANTLFAPIPSSPRSFATSNTNTPATQSSAVFSSSFFSASTSHLDDDLTSPGVSAASSSSRLPFMRAQQQEPQSAQTFYALDLDNRHSSSLHDHRQNHNQSKLPTFRFADVVAGKTPLLSQQTPPPTSPASPVPPSTAVTRFVALSKSHRRGRSENIPPKVPSLLKTATAPAVVGGGFDTKVAPTVVTAVSASASAPSLALPTSPTPYSTQKLQSALKRTPREQREPTLQQQPQESVSTAPSHNKKDSESGVREPVAERPKSQARRTQPPSASKTIQTQPQTNQNSRVRASTSSLEPTKQPTPILVASKRPASFPTSPRATQVTFVEPPPIDLEVPEVTVAKGSNRRGVVSSSATSSTGRAPQPSIRSHRVQGGDSPSVPSMADIVKGTATTAGFKPEHSPGPPVSASSGQERASSRDRAGSAMGRYSEDSRRTSYPANSRPPTSYKHAPPSPSTASSNGSTGGRVPPIRGFRTSAARKSISLETAASIALPNDDDTDLYLPPGHDVQSTENKVRTPGNSVDLSAPHDQRPSLVKTLSTQSIPQIMTPEEYKCESPEPVVNPDDTGDLFLNIARDESNVSNGRTSSAAAYDDAGFFSDDQRQSNTVSRVSRASHRRPMSTVIPSHAVPQSPSRVSRRLSDQQDTQARTRGRGSDDQSNNNNIPPRTLNYRSLARDVYSSAASAVGEESGRRSSVATRSHTSAGSRSLVFHDSLANDGPQYTSRRKPSMSEGISVVTSGTRTHKTATPYHRTYNSSPLASRNSIEQQLPSAQQIVATPALQPPQSAQSGDNAAEGTDSTTSTGGPSTMWDELDELKHRIHRLELTGKLPNSSSSAMSRVSDERPATAHTAATTNSGSSPKRPTATGLLSNAGSHNASTSATGNDNASTTSSQRETPSLLQAALNQAKAGVSTEVFRALELAATDALSLTTLMGSAGQPGPISSGASVIGFGGPQTVTDRQLRRKAEGVVRGLTELCIALSTESKVNSGVVMQSIENVDSPVSPTTIKGFSSIMTQRRSNTLMNAAPASMPSSPRAMSKFEERRNKLLNSPSLTAPRFSNNAPTVQQTPRPPPVTETQGRKSSMLLSRRRAETEEPEESGRKTSMLLRTRRAGTEEPEESGRKTSMLLRGRRGTGSDDDEPRLRAPSRAVTEVNNMRPMTRNGNDYGSNTVLPSIEGGNAGSAAPSASRRRAMMSSRLSGAPPVAATPTPRRFLDRQAADRDYPNSVEKMHSEERLQRPLSMGGAAMLSRNQSVSRRATRDR